MPDENHSGCERGSSEGARVTGRMEVKHSLPKRDGRTRRSIKSDKQTDRAGGSDT